MIDPRPEIRRVLRDHGRLPLDIDSLGDDADLFRAGMTSHASVNVMLGARGRVRHRVSRQMLKRSVFESVARDRGGDRRAASPGSVSREPIAVDGATQAFDRRTQSASVARGRRGRPHADEVDREARFPVEAIDALREAQALSALVPGRARRRRRLARGDRRAPASSSAAAARRPRWCSRCTRSRSATIARHLGGAPWFEDYLRELAREQRLIASVTSEIGTGGDMGRSIAAVTRGANGPLLASRSRRRRSATARTPTTCSRPSGAPRTPSRATRCSS